MFESLSSRLGDVFGRLRKRGALTEGDVNEALREVRVALLEADVALPVVKQFIDGVRPKAIGADVLRSVTPGQQVVKIVHDHLIELLGGESQGLDLQHVPPVPVLMVGLQGSGKTTSTAKLALRLQTEGKKVLMASLDTRRPAAQEQLKILGEQAGVPTLPIVPGQGAVDIARRAMTAGRLQGYDVVFLDTAGRLSIDEGLMAELVAVRNESKAAEVLLVADALTGQDAVVTARTFHERVGVTGIMLTRIDGDGRGGAALSMRAVTGAPIKFLGVGEKLDAIEAFHPDRVAGRILDMGDVVGLVERAAANIDKDEADKLARKMQKGGFDLDDLRQQYRQMRKMGGVQALMGMIPGMGKYKDQIAGANLDEKVIKRQEAIINSMTPRERRNPQIIAASRKRRIAAGSGTSVPEINRLLKQHQQMADMMKRMQKMGKKGLMRGGMPGMGNLPPGMFPPR